MSEKLDLNRLAPLQMPVFEAKQLREYAAISADDNLIHYDDETAKLAGFNGVIVHGMLSMAAMGNYLETRFPRPQYQIGNFKVRFRKIVYPGDVLECSATEKSPNPDYPGAIVLALSLKNEKGEVVCDGTATVTSPNP